MKRKTVTRYFITYEYRKRFPNSPWRAFVSDPLKNRKETEQMRSFWGVDWEGYYTRNIKVHKITFDLQKEGK